MTTPYPGKFKSSLCRNWLAGNCKYGIECNFAHGKAELNKREQQAKDSQSNNSKTVGSSTASKQKPGPIVKPFLPLNTTATAIKSTFSQRSDVKNFKYDSHRDTITIGGAEEEEKKGASSMSFDKYRGEGGASTVTSGQSDYENESAHLTGNSKYLASPSSLACDSQNDLNNDVSQSEESGPGECVSRDRSLETLMPA